LTVNVSGSLILGFLFAVLIEGRVVLVPWLRTAMTVGFVGAYTTFSTLTLETFRLLEEGSLGLAGANAVGSLAIGLVAVYAGVVLGRLV
jgi:fluoride exporter